ncbi:MAG: pyridoxal-phosphate dependent enzyme [Acidimicrobiia bacterium]|nr:pyridoxal-phosphate dependent enzyme [Acidimicrobiia bacterium]
MNDDLPAAAVRAAAAIEPHVRRTPLELLSDPGDGNQLWAKCENLQVTGSFKVRGAINALLESGEVARSRGVVTASTGNHGAAVAFGGYRLGIDVTVYTPEVVDPSKTAAIERWGARLVTVPGDPVDAELTAGAFAVDNGQPYISPYNDPAVVAGQGTVGIELTDQLNQIDTLIASVGGGGLICGTAAVLRAAHPAVRVIGASPVNSNVMMQSVAAGRITQVASQPTLSDGTAGGVESDAITFPMCQRLVDEWIAIDEDSIAAEMRSFIGTHHQLIEGSAAVALAAARRLSPAGITVVILCGANVAATTLRSVLEP